MIMLYLFLFKQKTAYEMRISDWSSDVCSSDLAQRAQRLDIGGCLAHHRLGVIADDLDVTHAAAGFEGDDRGFVENDAASADVDDGVHGAEVDGDVIGVGRKAVEEAHGGGLGFHARNTAAIGRAHV